MKRLLFIKFYHFPIILLLFFAFHHKTTQGAEFSLGIGAAEYGDSLYRPALSLHLGIKNIHTRGYYHERSFGPVKESFFLINIHNMFTTPFYKKLSAGYGISFLQQKTSLSFTEEENDSFNKNETNRNLGFLLGFYWSWFSKSPYFLRLGWEANIFLVGLSTIFLVTARQQILFLETGVYF